MVNLELVQQPNHLQIPEYVEGFGEILKLDKSMELQHKDITTQTYTIFGNNSAGSDTFDMNTTVIPAYITEILL